MRTTATIHVGFPRIGAERMACWPKPAGIIPSELL